MTETWRDIMGFEGLYKVSNMGRIKSLDKMVRSKFGLYRKIPGKVLAPTETANGYLRVCLTNHQGKKVNLYVHRIVCIAFHKLIAGRVYVNHKKGKKKDNRASNLEWCTAKENIEHAIKEGLFDRTNTKKYDDIDFLVYATCMINSTGKELRKIMTKGNFHNAVRGELKTSSIHETLNYLFEGKNTRVWKKEFKRRTHGSPDNPPPIGARLAIARRVRNSNKSNRKMARRGTTESGNVGVR